MLAGYIADPALASSVREAWRLTGEDRDLGGVSPGSGARLWR